MALDRFVRWQKKLRPTKQEVHDVLVDFLGGAGALTWERDRYWVTLPGRTSEAFRRVSTVDETSRKYAAMVYDSDPEVRMIEVWLSADCLDVITRHADDFTNGVAERLAAVFARFWDGKVEAG